MREQKRAQELWTIGAYVKQALASTILVAGLADKNTHNQMPKFPKCPYQEEVEERELTEEQKEYERCRLVQYLNSFGSRR